MKGFEAEFLDILNISWRSYQKYSRAYADTEAWLF